MALNGKNVLLVGGLGGIGYETSKLCLTRPITNLVIIDVVENSNLVKNLQALNLKVPVTFFKCDLTKKNDIQRVILKVVEKIKYIDVLINGAGVANDRNIELTINVNLIGLINTTLEALPYMDKKRHGRGGIILNIASVLGLEPFGGLCIYSASKFGVIGFTRSLSDTYYYNLTGVAVMAICPGLTETPLKNDVGVMDTFDYSKPITDLFVAAKSQTAEICAEHILRVIETNKNGTLWISDLGNLSLVEPKRFWQLTPNIK